MFQVEGGIITSFSNNRRVIVYKNAKFWLNIELPDNNSQAVSSVHAGDNKMTVVL